MSEDNSDLTVRILQRIQNELVGMREDNQGIHAELAGLRQDNQGLRQDMHEIRDELHGMNQRIDGVLKIAGTHHEDLDRRVSALEGRVGRLESAH